MAPTKTATKKWSEIRDGKLSPEARARVDARVQEELATLRALREAAGVTQVELAERMEIHQTELSRFERRDDHKLSTLAAYVEALGGKLEVVAVINGKRVVLEGV